VTATPPSGHFTADEWRYWVRNCQGFRVYSGGKRIGVVQDVLFGAQPGVPEALLVQTGLLRLGVRVIDVQTIQELEPQATRLVVASAEEGLPGAASE
jgi:uncharacterized protein YrrD